MALVGNSNTITTIPHETLTTRPPKNSFLLRRTSLIRRRKVQSVRLGGNKKKKGFVLLRLLKKVKLRWLKLHYSCMLKKLRSYYHSVVKDLIEAGATLETVQQRLLMETYFTVPGMGITAASVPYYAAPSSGDYHTRSIR